MAKGWKGYAHHPESGESMECWHEPLIEGEPKPGEIWAYHGTEVEILHPPVTLNGGRFVDARILERPHLSIVDARYRVSDLTPLPTPLPQKKRYRVDLSSEPWDWVTVEATDRDDLRDKLAALADDAEVVS